MRPVETSPYVSSAGLPVLVDVQEGTAATGTAKAPAGAWARSARGRQRDGEHAADARLCAGRAGTTARAGVGVPVSPAPAGDTGLADIVILPVAATGGPPRRAAVPRHG